MSGKYPVHSEYKDSGEEWLGSVPSHWDVIQIKHLSTVKRGASPRPIDDAKYFDDEGEYAWTRIADVTASDVYLTKATQRLSDLGSSLSVKLKPESLFLSIAGTVGKPCITGMKACIHDGFVYFPELRIPGKFLFYVFAGEQAYKGLGKFGTQLNLNTDTVGGIKIGCTENSELEKIVNFLDHETTKIDTLIEKQQQLIKLLKEKRQVVISHAVTKGLNPDAQMRDSGVEWLGEVPEHWSVSQVGHCAFVTKLTGFEYTNLWEIDDDGEVIALRGFNVKERKLELNDVERIAAELSARLERSKLAKGDVVFPCTGTIGNAAMIEKDNEFHINQNIAKIRFDVTVSSRFAIYWLTSSFIRTLIDRNNTSGMQPVVLIGDIRKLPMPRFNYQEQEEVADYLDSTVDRFNVLISNAVTAIELIQERRTALISAAVTGKIDVRNWPPLEPSNKQSNNKEAAV